MKPVKLMEREYSTPILGGGILPVMNAAMELGFSDFTMILVASVSCFYATLRVWQKVQVVKYGRKCVSCEKPVPEKPDPSLARVGAGE